MSPEIHELATSRRRLHWPNLTQAPPAHPPPEVGDCVDEFLLPWVGGAKESGRNAISDPAAPAGLLPPYITPQGRDLRIDLLRGFFVFAMIVDHVRGPSPIQILTGGNRFLTSAAEGFIFTSGLMAGLIYQRLVARDGVGASVRKVLSRTFTLYLLAVGLTLIFLPFSEALSLPWSQGIPLAKSLELVVGVLTLHRTYYLADVMLLYTLLFLLTPVALLLMARGKTGWLLAGSWLLWGLHQFFPNEATVTWPIAGNYLFAFSAWQLLFFNGLALGHQRHRIPALSCNGERRLFIFTGIATITLVALYLALEIPADGLPPQLAGAGPTFHGAQIWLHQYIFGKADLRPGRLVASAVVFTFLFLVLTRQWDRVRRPLEWLLAPLGQNALYAYTAHVAAVAVVALALTPFGLAAAGPPWLNATIQIASVLLIWLLARRQLLGPTPKTRSFWHASPAALALAALVVLPWLPSHAALAEPAPVSDAVLARARAYGTAVVRPNPGVTQPAATPAPPRANATPGPVARNPRPAASPPVEPLPPLPPNSERLDNPYVGELAGRAYARTFRSQLLDREMPYWVYLPPDYGLSDRRYPVLYALHGGGGNRDEWPAYGLLDTADRLMLARALSPFIIVLPQGDVSYWANWSNDSLAWGDYLAHEVVGEIDANFGTLPLPTARAVGGLSMGGWGAAHQAFLHPDIFGVVGIHSPSFYPDNSNLKFLGVGGEFASKDPLALAASLSDLDTLRIWIDVGQTDPWAEATIRLHDILQGRGIAHAWNLNPGGHNSEYWAQNVPNYLKFYGSVLVGQ